MLDAVCEGVVSPEAFITTSIMITHVHSKTGRMLLVNPCEHFNCCGGMCVFFFLICFFFWQGFKEYVSEAAAWSCSERQVWMILVIQSAAYGPVWSPVHIPACSAVI